MIGFEQIGQWSTSQLTKFVQQLMQDSDFLSAANKSFERLTVTSQLTLNDQLQMMQIQTTVGGAGGASALPAAPAGYFKVLGPDGAVYAVPFFKAT